jgi:hypothetical protein
MNVVAHPASRIADSGRARSVRLGQTEKEQTFLRCVKEGNIAQDPLQGNESPRTP